ncbi:MAG: hypothetical protein CVU57_11910 [Deltaproteobacteria bacterium HGW-Deltaproteobacteria-15]|jgi:hypothetical protein|nr:MAG: hypothetical protein CVU57_11910 [Deltaproteobacteria bacterium HGW-Deltaproteobacteria-15]
MTLSNKSYFTEIWDEYVDASEYNSELYQNMAKSLNKVLFGRVVDFGNGGIINYDTDTLAKVICVDILFKNKVLTENRIDFIYGDFYNIRLEGKADCILAQFLFHHLTDDRKLKGSLRIARCKLNDDGKLLVGEVVVPRGVEIIQNMLRPVLFYLLKALRKPELRFFSIRSLRSLLFDQGFVIVRIETIPTGKRLRPAPVLFPKMEIPGRLYPLRCVLIQAAGKPAPKGDSV